jgi:D-sedoheptulose 7-phosphate isomerase
MNNLIEIIAAAVSESLTMRQVFSPQREQWLLKASELLASALTSGNKILIAGNGGSAADAQHFAAEFVVRLTSDNNRRALPAMALTTDTSTLTAAANDYGFEQIFARQIEAFGGRGDVFIGLTTSGQSPNILAAFRVAKATHLRTLGLFGENGLVDSKLCELPLNVPASATMRIQEEHAFALHLLALLTEMRLFDK